MTTLRDTPCETCGWKYPGFHVCVDLSKPIDPKIVRKHNQLAGGAITPSHRQRLADGLSSRWAKHREETRDRDAAIVERYRTGAVSIKGLAREFGIAAQTMRGILFRAQMRGEVEIRPRGNNARWEQGVMR